MCRHCFCRKNANGDWVCCHCGETRLEHSGLILPGDPEFTRKPAGHIIMGGVETAETLQCAHCGVHWIAIRGSGRRRGFCLNCMKTTCGSPLCDPCLPYQKRMEMRGRAVTRDRKDWF